MLARNCLVGLGNIVKVADFGLTRRLEPNASFWTPPKPMKIPIKWCSPEVLHTQRFSEASDVWSFGVLMWEIMSQGENPYPGIQNHEMLRRLKAGERLEKPKQAFDAMYHCAMSCWEVCCS